MMCRMVELFDELTHIADALNEAGIPYAVCGGVALAIHGSPRATRDIDFLLEPSDLPRVVKALKTKGYAFQALPMRFQSSGVEVQRVSKIVGTDLFTVDFLLVNESLREIWSERIETAFAGRKLWVVSREGLITLKLTAGRPQDLADIVRLKEQE